MSVREFAGHLGVSDRMVSKWEAAGEAIHPRPMNQAALDEALRRASVEAKARFESSIDADAVLLTPEQGGSAPDGHQVRHPGDGKLMTFVDAGVYLSGPTNTPIWLAAFYLDVYPTTNADYARFIAATGHKPPIHWIDGKCPDDLLNHPVIYVTWHDANAYTRWADKTLPTGQQWEKTARGTRGDIYPWGSQPTPAKCNVRESKLKTTTPVDRYHSGVSPYGAYDMCGNTWEWCATETTPGRFELKGSAFTSGFERAAPSEFNDANADMFDNDTAFRCAAAADEMQALLAS